jgi:hypothetical protein
MATTTVAVGGIPYIYEGAPFHARALTLAAVYDTPWEPDPGTTWEEHGYVPRCWTHPAFRGHILCKPEDDVVVIAHESMSTPRLATISAMAQLALGSQIQPSSVGMYPLAVRLPMKGPGSLLLPPGNFRSRRLWPLGGEKAHVRIIENIPVEFRISGTRTPQTLSFCAEAFIGRTHETTRTDELSCCNTRVPRAMIFAGDARHVLLAPTPQQLKRFTARLMDSLLVFAYFRRDDGLEVDHRALTGRQLGRVQMSTADPGDVEFKIRLPQPGGMESYVGSWVSP